jgi:transposase
MKESRRIYSKEFKTKAVELGNLRGNVQEVARELGIRGELIYRWRNELGRRPESAFEGNGKVQLSEEQRELARLRKKLADVEMERDILKKAVGIFSVSDRKYTGS